MLILLLSFTLAHAESLESHYLRKMAHAQVAADVLAHQATYEQLRVLRTGCSIQIQEGEVPSLCYAAERMAVQLGLHPSNLETRQRLDRLCTRAAERLRLRQADIVETSSACRAKVEEAKRIEAYRREDQDTWSEI